MVTKLIERVESTFIKHFSNSNRRKGMAVLRPKRRIERHRITFLMGNWCFTQMETQRGICFYKEDMHSGAIRSVGFDKLIPLEEFIDVSNGFLVDDTCVFGAEVFVCKERRTGRGQCLTRVKGASVCKHVCKQVEKISKLGAEVYRSEPFSAGGMKIKLYPDGNGQAKGSHVSLFLGCVGSQLVVEFKLGILDQIHQKPHHESRTGKD
ncbi:hypothetical protein ACLB2K_039798 [Fragaria x ananassa]